MLRVAKITSAVLTCLILIATITSSRAGVPQLGGPVLVYLLTMALSLAALHLTPPLWLIWATIVLNMLWSCLGLFLAVGGVLGLLGLEYFVVPKPLLLILAATFLLLFPCVANAYTLFRHKRPFVADVRAA
jgi:hypothetical protein